MRVQVRYAKTGKVRFISAIDLGRVWERSLRAADVPIAYSEGFSPHPRISFVDALPLGYASTGEYAELVLAAPVELPAAVAAMNAAFPGGLRILRAAAAEPGAPKLARRIQASCWDLTFPASAEAVLQAAVARAAAAPALPVARERKGETTQADLRPAVHEISTAGAVVRVVLRHADHQPGDAGGVAFRPTEVEQVLRGLAAQPAPIGAALEDLPSSRVPAEPPTVSAPPGLPAPTLVTRVAQGLPTADGLEEALDGGNVPPLGAQSRKRAS